MASITGTLEHTNYGDNEERELEAGTYSYDLTASGEGKLSFKVETRVLDEHGGGAHWETVERKEKIRDGSFSGTFDAAATVGDQTLVRFNFNREFLGKAVDYQLDYVKA